MLPKNVINARDDLVVSVDDRPPQDALERLRAAIDERYGGLNPFDGPLVPAGASSATTTEPRLSAERRTEIESASKLLEYFVERCVAFYSAGRPIDYRGELDYRAFARFLAALRQRVGALQDTLETDQWRFLRPAERTTGGGNVRIGYFTAHCAHEAGFALLAPFHLAPALTDPAVLEYVDAVAQGKQDDSPLSQFLGAGLFDVTPELNLNKIDPDGYKLATWIRQEREAWLANEAAVSGTANDPDAATAPRRSKRGRKPDTDKDADKQLRDEWQEKKQRFPNLTRAQFAADKGMKPGDVVRALDRVRHREK
jgi:hypothetical protein